MLNKVGLKQLFKSNYIRQDFYQPINIWNIQLDMELL